MKKTKKDAIEDLYTVFLSLETPQEAEQFFTDIFTPQELETLTERWQLVCQLKEGIPQRQIAQNLGVAIATISRGSRQLQYGSGGFDVLYKKMKKNSV